MSRKNSNIKSNGWSCIVVKILLAINKEIFAFYSFLVIKKGDYFGIF